MDIVSLHLAAWERLQQRRKQLPHAFLIHGPRGIGQFEFALAFAHGLLCESPRPNGTACGGCQACHWLDQGNHPDIRYLLPEAMQAGRIPLPEMASESDANVSDTSKRDKKLSQQVTMDQVRELSELISVGTHRNGLRIIVIFPAENMNRNAANAVLKSLEEPPPNTLFLLVSSSADQLLPTIRSRCQQVVMSLPERSLSMAFLERAGQVSASAQRSLAEFLDGVGGAPLLALSMLEHEKSLSWLNALLDGLAQGGKLDALALAASLDKALKEQQSELCSLRTVCDWVQRWIHDLSLQTLQQPAHFLRQREPQLQRLAAGASVRKVLQFYRETLLTLRQDAEHPLNHRLFMEALFSGYRDIFQPH